MILNKIATFLATGLFLIIVALHFDKYSKEAKSLSLIH